MNGYVLFLFYTVVGAVPFTIRAPHDAVFGLDSSEFNYEILDVSSIERAVKDPPVVSTSTPTSVAHAAYNDASAVGNSPDRVLIITDAGLTAVSSRANVQSAVDSGGGRQYGFGTRTEYPEVTIPKPKPTTIFRHSSREDDSGVKSRERDDDDSDESGSESRELCEKGRCTTKSQPHVTSTTSTTSTPPPTQTPHATTESVPPHTTTAIFCLVFCSTTTTAQPPATTVTAITGTTSLTTTTGVSTTATKQSTTTETTTTSTSTETTTMNLGKLFGGRRFASIINNWGIGFREEDGEFRVARQEGVKVLGLPFGNERGVQVGGDRGITFGDMTQYGPVRNGKSLSISWGEKDSFGQWIQSLTDILQSNA